MRKDGAVGGQMLKVIGMRRMDRHWSASLVSVLDQQSIV